MPAIKSRIQEAWKVNQKLEQFAVAPFCPHGNVKRKKVLLALDFVYTCDCKNQYFKFREGYNA